MRTFRLNSTGRLLAVVAVLAMTAGSVDAQDRRVGTIGPPPRKNPQRQTSAEAFPPLPLPVTPLRRSEPKAEPAPPLFCAKLKYGDTQDYMPNPGDIDNLMRHARAELGLWYGWKLLDLNELVALHKEGRGSKLPMLHITGYHEFKLAVDQREALRQYLLDGGTIVADATLGSPDFTRGFRSEMRAMFPSRSFDLLQLDHPVYRAYYKYTNVHYFDVEGGTDSEIQGPPEFLGLNLGTRTAVVFSPNDMTCGWDEFIAPPSKRRVPEAPRDKAMLPADALRMGLNLVSYVAAMREVGAIESVTRQAAAPTERTRQRFTLAQLKHQGDWNPDPNSTFQWLRHLSLETSLAVNFDLKSVDPDEPRLAEYPFLYMTGFRDPKFSDEQIIALRRHIDAGGILFINNCSGYSEFDKHVRTLVGELFPDQRLAPVKPEHPLLDSLFDVKAVRDRRTGAPREVQLEGITVRERLVIVYSKADMITQLKQVSDPYGNGYDAESCRQLALNVVAYALQN